MAKETTETKQESPKEQPKKVPKPKGYVHVDTFWAMHKYFTD